MFCTVMRLYIGEVGGYLGREDAGVAGLIFDPRDASICRGVSLVKIYFWKHGVFGNNLTTVVRLFTPRLI